MNLKKEKKYLVINIKANTLTFCLGSFDYANIKIDKLFKVNLDFDIYEESKIKDEKLLADKIKEILKLNKIKTKRCYVYVLGHDLVRKKLFVPYMENEEDLRDLIYMELSQVLPLDLDNFIVRYKLISEITENTSSEEVKKVLLNCVLMDKEIVESYHRVIKMVGLKPEVLDINSSAIENLIKLLIMKNSGTGLVSEEIENSVIGFVEIDVDYCSIYVLKKGIIDFTRVIKTYNIDKALYESYDFFSIVKNNDYSCTDDAIYEFSNNLLYEINLFLQYYCNSSRINNIDEIFFYGNACKFYGMRECAQDILKTSVNIITKVSDVYDNFEDDIECYVGTIGGLARW